jgi:hypothetical protein
MVVNALDVYRYRSNYFAQLDIEVMSLMRYILSIALLHLHNCCTGE